MRDAESRTRFLGYRVERYKLFIWTLSACMAGVAGALYVPQVGIINPGEFTPIISIEIVIWVAIGGRGTLYGAIISNAVALPMADKLSLRNNEEKLNKVLILESISGIQEGINPRVLEQILFAFLPESKRESAGSDD